MKFLLDAPKESIGHEDKEVYARMIVALAGSDDFDETQKDENFAEIYDLAVKYLDKELADEKESNWQKIIELT